jgi:hypothetical protein
MDIVEKWHSDMLVTSRKKLFDLVDMYRKEKHDNTSEKFSSEQEYIAYSLHELRNDRLELYSYTVLIQFFEDLGLLCYKNYIRQDDIFDFMGRSIEYQLGCYGEHIRRVRENQDGTINKSLYANAIYLYKEAKRFRRTRSLHEEDMWEAE